MRHKTIPLAQKTGVVGSNTLRFVVLACVWAMFVLLCAGTSLAMGLIHVQENPPAVYMIQNLVINRTESLMGQGRRILASYNHNSNEESE
jgi:hypothetical protein